MKKKMGKYWILAGMVLCLVGCTEKTDGKTETEQTVLEQEMNSGEQEAVAGSLRAVTGDTGGEWMIDGDGTAVSRRYEDIWEEDIRSRRETARYTEGGKTGYFSVSSGEILIPAQYAEASRMEDKGAVVGDGNKKWLIDEQGRRVSDEYDDLKQPDQGWIAAKQSKWGIVDQDGKEIIPFEYDSLYLQTIFAAALAEKEGIAYYIYFGEGEPQITELGPYEIGPVYEEGWSVIHDRDGSGGIIGWNGDVYFRSDCSLTIARNTEDGVYLLSSQGDDGRYGAVCFWAEERRASELVPPVYSQELTFSSSGMAGAEKDGKLGLIDLKTGEFKELEGCISMGEYAWDCLPVQLEDGYVFLDGNDDPMGEERYDYAENLNEDGFAVVQKSGKMGLTGFDGSRLLPLEYEKVTDLGDGFVLTEKDGSWQMFEVQWNVLSESFDRKEMDLKEIEGAEGLRTGFYKAG